MFYISIILSLFLFFSSTVFATNDTDKDSIENVLINYFKYREQQANPNIDNSILLNELNSKKKISSDVENFERNRQQRYKKMEDKLKIRVVFTKGTPYIKSIDINKNNAIVDVYEWINFDWAAENDTLNSSGLGIHHEITLIKDKENWIIQKDSYDEGPLTEVTTSDINLFDKYELDSNKENRNTTIMNNDMNSEQIGINSIPGHYISFNRGGVTSYADLYVKPGANGGKYTDYYNKAYKDFNSNGGDCANYVSQSLYEGGKLPMVGLLTHYNGTGAWWYDNKGTTPTTDDTVSINWSWTGAHYNRENIAYNYGTIIDNPTNSDIKQGNPVYYDWDGKYKTNRWYEHAAICVGTDSNGVPIVNSHNYDYYHVRWNYGYSNTGYSTVQIPNTIFIPD